jgi:trans-aconitate 2-methyltransferase
VNKYTFGDDRLAVERLRLVATAYEPVSRSFLIANTEPPPKVALDLGCGPGFTTQLLNEVCQPEILVGIDSSDAFVHAAQGRLPGVRFETQDVSEVPLPGAPADVIYARLLLAHMAEPEVMVRRWLTQLAPGGRLLVEDLEDVVNPPGPLQNYEVVSAAIVRSRGGLLYAGAALANLGGDLTPVTVPGALAATIYLFNVQHWLEMHDLPVTHTQLRDLEEGLVELSMNDQCAPVSWIVRQVVVTQ